MLDEQPIDQASTSRFPWDALRVDRRRFLVGASAVAIVGTAVGCDKTSTQPSALGATAAATADAALAPPGSPGLFDEAYFASRVNDFLGVATADPSSTNTVGVAARLIRAAREPGYQWAITAVTPDSFASSWDRIDNWKDTRDFDLMYLHWLLELGQGSTPMTQLSIDVIAAIKQRMLANRYRYNDPLPPDRIDNEWFWSENHRIIGAANEYLAGQRFPNDTFAVSGLTGAQLRDRTKPDILEWVVERAQLGFFEWHSNVYLLKDISPLLMLTELADDPEIVTAAAMALDLCFLDLAAHLQRGCFTAPRGRTYEKDKMSALFEDTFGTTKFLFNDTDAGYPSLTDAGATHLCAAKRYRPPQVLLDIATSADTTVVRERHGVFFDGSQPVQRYIWAPYGKDFTDQTNLPFWWSLGAVGMWPMAQLGVATANEFRLWDTDGFDQIKLLAALNGYDPVKIRDWEQARAAVINFGFLSEANTYAWRHPKVSLASAIDHRKGEMRDQAHAWQATIDENAMMFTTHPAAEPPNTPDWNTSDSPGYWTGSGSLPRSAQYQRMAIHLYDPAWDQSTDPLVWSVLGYRPYTHAYVPQDHFDQIVQTSNWTVGERSGAYIALWSWRDPTWREYDASVYAARGFTKSFDLVASGGADNVWIVECGTSEDDGSIEDFVAALTAHEPEVQQGAAGFTVDWHSPSAGAVSFGWDEPFVVAGQSQALGDFPRHESPWGTIARDSLSYELASSGAHWHCDFEARSRSVS